MFGKFLKPRWQHGKVEVRRQALLDLDGSGGDHAAIFIQVAREDEEASLRGLAVKRLYDLGVLRQIMESDRDAGVQDQATRRYGRLLCGQETGIELSRRLQALSGETSSEIIELIARRGVEAQLRLLALERVSRESLLGDLAIEDEDPAVRLAAAQRLSQPSTMKRVARHSRSRDKQVYTLIQQQLDDMQEAQEKPERVQKEARQICSQLETLTRVRDMAATTAQKQGLENQWQALMDEWRDGNCGSFPEDLRQRYDQALLTWQGVYQQYLAEDSERRQQEQVWQQLRERRQALIDELQQALDRLHDEEHPALNERRDLLHRVQRDWEQLEPLPGAEQMNMVGQYRKVREALAEAITHAELHDQLDESLRRLQRDIGALAGAVHISDKRLEELGRRFEQLEKQGRVQFAERCLKLRATLDSVQERFRQQELKHQQDLERYRSLVPTMEKQLAGGHTAAALRSLQELRAIQRRLPHQGRGELSDDLQHRCSVVAAELDNIRDWRRWSGTSHKEKLVEEVEKLAQEVGSNPDAVYDLNALAAQVRAAREEWKKLGEADPDISEELWERFNSACSRAYAPCGEYFHQQEEERESHRRHKETICEGLEAFFRDKLADADLDTVDWQAVEKIVQVAQDEWRAAGAVNRKESKALNKRFHDALDALRGRMHERSATAASDKRQMIETMQRLLEQAEGLAGDSPEFLHLLQEARNLQARWKDIGRAAGEHKLWKRFRALNDDLFGRRTAHLEAEKESQEFNLQQKNEIIAEIQALAALPPEDFDVAQRRYLELRGNWKKVGLVPRARLKDLDKRYHQACRRFENSEEAAARVRERLRLDVLEQKAELCFALEALLATDAADLRDRVEEAQRQWQQLSAVGDDLEPVVAKRFQKAVTALLKKADGDAGAATRLLQEGENAAAQRLELCLRMELLADVDSPEELRAQRMEYQLAHLAERMRGETESDEQAFLDILYRWYRLPVFAEETAPRQRFLEARNHYLNNN